MSKVLFHRIWRHYRFVIVIIIAGILLTLTVIYFQQKYTSQQFENKLILRATDEAAHIKQRINNIIEIMASIRNFYAASNYVDRNEFYLFVKDQVAIHPELRALEWAPVVKEAERIDFEMELSRVVPQRRITEKNADDVLVDAGTRAEYFPVFYIEPLQGNEPALGYDLNSEIERSRVLQQAIAADKIVFSDMVHLVQDNNGINGVLLMQPVYNAKTNQLQGIALGVIELDKLVRASIKDFNPTGLDVLLVNNRIADRPQALHFHVSRSRVAAIAMPDLNEILSGMHYIVPINVPGGEWQLYFRPAPAFYAEFESGQNLIILFGGIILTAMLAANIIRRIRYTEDILYQAKHDALTGLPNRSLFAERLTQALMDSERTKTTSAVLYLDLDNFKHINDSLGHAIGDQLLIEVSRRLRINTRDEDTIARMGGDEFILLVQNFRQEDDIARLSQKMLQDLTRPYQIGERIFYLSASVGISIFPRDAMNAEALIANADAAMYRAKSRGRNTYDFYSTDLTTISLQRMQIELELRQAMKQGVLDVYYQPQVDLASGAIVGAEALARWHHEEHGMVSPQLFISIAEECGLIMEIGEWVLRRACQQAKLWIDNGIQLSSMAVNVSGIQLQRSDFVMTVQKVLAETELPARYLELELTESVIMEQADQAIDTLLGLGKLGVTLAIDDFGTGHSSLAYLKRLPLDKIKIDRSFIHDLPDDEEDVAITSAIIALSSSLGLRVTAEGVETREQKMFLKGMGCHEAQGYYFSRPVPAEEFPHACQAVSA